MTLAWRRLKVYLKIALMAVVALVAMLTVIKNRNNTAPVWFFGPYEQVNVLWLVLITAVSAVVIWWGTWKIAGVVKELREVQRMKESQAQKSEQDRRAAELAERERRLDEKLRDALRDDEQK